MRKLRLREAKAFAQHYPAGKELSWTLGLEVLRYDATQYRKWG